MESASDIWSKITKQFLKDLRMGKEFKWVFSDEMGREAIHKAITEILTDPTFLSQLSRAEKLRISKILGNLDEVFEVASITTGKIL